MRVKRTAAAAVASGIVASGLLLTGGAANAMPSDTPCGAGDVTTAITPDPSHAAGHEAYVLTYTATSGTTNCKLEGPPTALTFVADGQQLPGIEVTAAPGNVPVNLRAGHPAESRIIQPSAAFPGPVAPTALGFDLPTGPHGQPVTAAWPAGAPVKGTEIQVTPVSAA